MLKIVKNPEFTAPVKVQVPAEGGYADMNFTARFKALTVSESEAFDMMSIRGTDDWLRTILIGWDGVVGEDDQPLSFNNAVRDQLLDVPFIRMAIIQAYNAAMMGAKRGN
ncbi:hypothetical protein [Pseudotabrizicola algicola]|uniref:Phage protein n=1 Tax=Pseudotabrizicola algicola TaxID=2709381 RepID=A0A6B3RNH1_9RHOB|nr:hypothetical protein [Pseudotabrizicola algicola]NEX47600.1 hypothetical protein [Pseudotabrizicola algicola]